VGTELSISSTGHPESHEITYGNQPPAANAETEHFAVPTLLNEVSAAAASTSWSPTDAVASCLVMHFLGFEDNAAGSWQCPVELAASVAAHIHDTIVTTQTTASCGVTSHASSTLTFTASLGTLTVTSPRLKSSDCKRRNADHRLGHWHVHGRRSGRHSQRDRHLRGMRVTTDVSRGTICPVLGWRSTVPPTRCEFRGSTQHLPNWRTF
jgi:hypothetical protein